MLAGTVIAVVNVLFVGTRYGFGALPGWFYLVNLLLIPAMFFTLPMFRRAMTTRPYAQRAGLYAVGWAPPYLIYSVSGEALRPGVNLSAVVVSSLLFVVIFALVFAAIRKPQA